MKVIIDIHALGGPPDTLIMRGKYQLKPVPFPRVAKRRA